jgi:hypothetical protein
MTFLQLNSAKYRFIVFGAIIGMAALHVMSGTREASRLYVSTGPDDTEFIFAGKCPNGESYRMHNYAKTIQGESLSFFDYQGPAGQGSVGTTATAQVMAARICRSSAEIMSVY